MAEQKLPKYLWQFDPTFKPAPIGAMLDVDVMAGSTCSLMASRSCATCSACAAMRWLSRDRYGIDPEDTGGDYPLPGLARPMIDVGPAIIEAA